jgi:hypothetical protein
MASCAGIENGPVATAVTACATIVGAIPPIVPKVDFENLTGSRRSPISFMDASSLCVNDLEI